MTHNDLKAFLRQNGHLSTDSDLIAIVRRIDLDNDAMLNSEEFSQALRVVEPGISYYLKHDEGRWRDDFQRVIQTEIQRSGEWSFVNSSPLRKSSPVWDPV